MKTIVEVEGLRKVYRETVAVDGISFQVQEGEIFGIVGPNGAGKTTTIECLEGLRKPDGGKVRVMGANPRMAKRSFRERIGMQLQESNLPDHIRVWEALDLYSSFYKEPADWRELMERLGLQEKRNAFFAKLSGGQKQRVFIALALLPDPRLVFLDELTTGLDPQARHTIWDLLRQVRSRGTTIILSSHFMEEAETLCDRVAILNQGRIVALDEPQALIRDLQGGQRVIFSLDGPWSPDLQKSLSKVGDCNVEGSRAVVSSRKGDSSNLVGKVVRFLENAKVSFHDLHTEQPDLEDVFLKFTSLEDKN